MHDWQSLAHVRWECKYHVVIIPKFRRKIIYGQLRRQVGRILRELCAQRGVELIEGKALVDHVHLCLSIPPKYSVAHTVGFLTRISDMAVVPYRQDQAPRLDFWGSDVRNHTTEGDTRWVNYSTRRFSSRSTVS